jgi:hypothetical protein
MACFLDIWNINIKHVKTKKCITALFLRPLLILLEALIPTPSLQGYCKTVYLAIWHAVSRYRNDLQQLRH